MSRENFEDLRIQDREYRDLHESLLTPRQLDGAAVDEVYGRDDWAVYNPRLKRGSGC